MNETPDTNVEQLLAFFKALADSNRLKILGLLATQEMSVEHLSDVLQLSPSTVSHHLSRLSDVGLVSARPDSYYNMYRFKSKSLETMAKSLLRQDTLPAAAANVDLEAFDRKVLKAFLTPDGKIKSLPTQQKKLEAILRHVAKIFEPGERYSEKQVNLMLSQYYGDTATLRRELIDNKLLNREGGGGEYWKPVD